MFETKILDQQPRKVKGKYGELGKEKVENVKGKGTMLNALNLGLIK